MREIKDLKQLIKRVYTKDGVDVYSMFEWKRVDVVMTNWKTNEKVVDMPNVEFPEHFSQNACDIIASKYFKQNIPYLAEGKETSFKQLVERMVNFWVSALKDEKMINDKQGAILHDELAYMMCAQMWAPNSPQWFNTGMAQAYGIKGEPRGHFYYDEKLGKVVESEDEYTRTQGSACFIVSVEDSLLGNKSITHQLEVETRLFKSGSGVGTNWSAIRAEGEPLSGGGKSSGLMSFLDVFNANAGAIKSGGTTRRAAKINVLDIEHPDIEKYIEWKAREEQKVRDLGKMGYDTHFDGEAYATVGGQNANNSVRVTDEYMNSLSDNGSFKLTRRVDGKVIKDVNAKELWNKIAKAAWECGDPGLQYDTTINAWHTCPAGEDGKLGAKRNRINASNPCFTGDMRLLTDNGYKTFKSLSEQEYVAVINKDGLQTVGKVWSTGVKDIIEIEFANGKKVKCTPNHLFLTDTGEFEAKDLLGKKVKAFEGESIEVVSLTEKGQDEVFDFNEPSIHWGVVEGFIAHNCSEYMFLDDTACNLASINLMAFYDKDADLFDIEGYKHCISLCQLVLEATIHWGQFPTEEIARKSYMFRTTGLGYANLGALLMCMGYGYDTEEARQIGSSLLGLLTGQSYLTSALMAKKVEPFKYFNLNKEHMLKVIDNHRLINKGEQDKCVGLSYIPYGIDGETLDKVGFINLDLELAQVWDRAYDLGKEYGYRNAQVSVLAPTGTISFAMDCSTTSSEPFFGNMVWKKLVGGGGMSIVNDCIPYGLKTLGYTEQQIEEIVEYVEKHLGLIEGAPHIKEEHLEVFDTANKASGGKRYIEPMGHVRMMAALTPQVSGAISKTVNMPNDATVEDIEEIYYRSWEMGVKAIALYRDGCKASQPLNMMGSEEGEKKLEDMSYSELLEKARELDNLQKINGVNANRPGGPDETLVRVKPQGIRNAKVHAVEIGGIKLYITVSRYEDGNIAEVYVSAGRQGTLVKGLLDSISTTISEMIQYGVDPKDIAKMYRGQKFEPSGFVGGHPYIKMADSISDLISKIIDIELGDYTYCQVKPKLENKQASDVDLPEKLTISQKPVDVEKSKYSGEVIYGETCKTCGSDKLAKNGTCKVCQNCGTTTGCS